MFPLFSEKELYSYTKSRPGVLENIDIFKEGLRSEGHPSDFSLFKESKGERYSADILVFPYYLELFEFFKRSHMIPSVLRAFCAAHPTKTVVAQWNHDVDFSVRFPTTDPYPLATIKNLKILNFNTSKKNPNDILLPFWTIDSNLVEAPKEYNYGFIGQINHNIRMALIYTFWDDDSFYAGNKLEFQEFRRTVSSCRFSLCPRGVGLSSWRFFECMHLNTIPVLFADEVVLPYPDLDYSKICVRIPENRAMDKKYIEFILSSVNEAEMLKNIKEVRHRFTLKGVQEEVHKCLLNL